MSHFDKIETGAVGSQLSVITAKGNLALRTQELTASGAVTATVNHLQLNHATVVIAATVADASTHEGLFVITDTSASGTAAHTVTLTAGTFDGTSTVATLNAPGECLIVCFDADGAGVVVANIGGVALS